MICIGKPETEKEFQEYYHLRWLVLRAPWNQTQGSEKDDLDITAEHVTARDRDGTLIGIGRLHMSNNKVAQIRYMAIEEIHRGNGIGKAIIKRLESIARESAACKVTLNARDYAVGFYESLGYCSNGPGHTIYGVISHTKMHKFL